jgi:hypothetical protein
MNAHDLSARLSELLRREHESMADFLVALADFDSFDGGGRGGASGRGDRRDRAGGAT